MEFLNGLLGEGGAWPMIISGVFGVLSLFLGAKWKKAKKELKEFGVAANLLIDLITDMPDKPSANYLRKVKSAGFSVAKEFKDIILIFKKEKDAK